MPIHRLPASIILATMACLGCAPGAEPGRGVADVFGGSGRWVDLTWSFSDSTIYWPTDTAGFRHDTVAYGPTPAGFFYSSFRYSANEHGGTHLDAPIHFAEGKDAADEIPLTALIGPAVVIDVSAKADADYLATVEDFTAWEAIHGRIPDQAIVLLRTGWGERYHDRMAYLGTAATGPAAVSAAALPGARRRGGRVAGVQPEAPGLRARHAERGPRAIDRLPGPRDPLWREHPRLRERRTPGAASCDGQLRRGPADEDQGRQRRAAPDRGVPAVRTGR